MNHEFIHWLGHASFFLDVDGKNIYIDPWKLGPNPPKADLILITHSHHDHYSPADIEKINTPETQLVGPADVCVAYTGLTRVVVPGEKIQINDFVIDVLPAYNRTKQYHPRENGWVGYNILLKNGIRIYHTGDTDFIPEMSGVQTDILLLPIGGTYTMDAVAAAEAVNTIAPELVIPMHWGDIVGSIADVKAFQQLVNTTVIVKTSES